jgi:hypothetical protein
MLGPVRPLGEYRESGQKVLIPVRGRMVGQNDLTDPYGLSTVCRQLGSEARNIRP